MTAQALAIWQDLEDMWRPLDASEQTRATSLLARASSLLRQVAPHIDDRLALWSTNPTDPAALDPVLVSTVVATIVKRFISNIEGVASQSVGPFSVSYALRSETSVRGELQVTREDLNALRPSRRPHRLGSIRVRPALAPSPLASGSFYANSAILATGLYDSALETEFAGQGFAAEGVFLEQVEGPM